MRSNHGSVPREKFRLQRLASWQLTYSEWLSALREQDVQVNSRVGPTREVEVVGANVVADDVDDVGLGSVR
jgi:hypothetical protein